MQTSFSSNHQDTKWNSRVYFSVVKPRMVFLVRPDSDGGAQEKNHNRSGGRKIDAARPGFGELQGVTGCDLWDP